MKAASAGPAFQKVLLADIGGTNARILAGSPFRAHFEEKGRFRRYLEPIPTYLVLDEDAAFLGLRTLVEVEGIG